MCVWHWLKKPTFFTIQIIFATIHGSHCTFWYHSWVLLYYFSYLLGLFTAFSAKSFQFQLNKLFPNRHWMWVTKPQSNKVPTKDASSWLPELSTSSKVQLLRSLQVRYIKHIRIKFQMLDEGFPNPILPSKKKINHLFGENPRLPKGSKDKTPQLIGLLAMNQ